MFGTVCVLGLAGLLSVEVEFTVFPTQGHVFYSAGLFHDVGLGWSRVSSGYLWDWFLARCLRRFSVWAMVQM